MSATDIEQTLAEARRHRASGRLDLAGGALQRAWEQARELGVEHPLRQITAWRRAKLAHDRNDPAGALAALAPVLEDPDPFEHYPRGLDACEALARRYWDTVGYGAPLPRRLWERFSQAWTERGDPFLAASGRAFLAWDLACAGELDRLEAVLEELAVLDPLDFRRGPTRHPRAPDAPGSVPWIQLDIARTCLRAATWAHDPRLARVAAELLEDAAEEAGLEREAELWFLEPMALAGIRLGLPERRYFDAWQRAAAHLSHERAPLHVAIARAEAARAAGADAEAIAAFLEAADLAERHRWGFEWAIDALIEAARTPGGQEAWLERARRIIADRGVHVFG